MKLWHILFACHAGLLADNRTPVGSGRFRDMTRNDNAASNAGLLGLMHTVALEFSPYGITCNAVLPGLIQTEKMGELPHDIREAAIERIPAGRTGKPEEVAALVAFLASPLAGYITGAAIPSVVRDLRDA